MVDYLSKSVSMGILGAQDGPPRRARSVTTEQGERLLFWAAARRPSRRSARLRARMITVPHWISVAGAAGWSISYAGPKIASGCRKGTYRYASESTSSMPATANLHFR